MFQQFVDMKFVSPSSIDAFITCALTLSGGCRALGEHRKQDKQGSPLLLFTIQ